MLSRNVVTQFDNALPEASKIPARFFGDNFCGLRNNNSPQNDAGGGKAARANLPAPKKYENLIVINKFLLNLLYLCSRR